ncbi:MAG: hypothetical protein V7739_10320 [Motiliproteus sp.]
MIIESSSIQLTAEHEKYQFSEQTSSFEAFKLELNSANLRLSDSSIAAAQQDPWSGLSNSNTAGINSLFGIDQSNDVNGLGSSLRQTRDQLFQALLDAITERLDRYSAGSAATETAATAASAATDGTDPAENTATEPSPQQPGSMRLINLNVMITEHIEEFESTQFSAGGQVNTADGESFEFNLDLQMSRSYEATRDYQETQQILFKDPLVLNFNGNAAELTEDQYEFDIDADGELDWISMLTSDSGMLALDKNNDGIINDGSELFGAISGDGFSDLSEYDEDNNGFIDEADSIFAELQLWNQLGGEDQLYSLAEKDVGAIYLGSIDTPFDLKATDNQSLGQVIESGIYLQEDGGVGSVQQIDLAV